MIAFVMRRANVNRGLWKCFYLLELWRHIDEFDALPREHCWIVIHLQVIQKYPESSWDVRQKCQLFLDKQNDIKYTTFVRIYIISTAADNFKYLLDSNWINKMLWSSSWLVQNCPCQVMDSKIQIFSTPQPQPTSQ